MEGNKTCILLNRLYQERAEKRNELSTHKQNILTQLEYEREKLSSSEYLELHDSQHATALSFKG